MTKRTNSAFRANWQGHTTFVCSICDRNTRDTGQGVDHLCAECFEICGLDNTVTDEPKATKAKVRAEVMPEVERALAKAIKLGSNGDKIKATNTSLWPKAPKAKPGDVVTIVPAKAKTGDVLGALSKLPVETVEAIAVRPIVATKVPARDVIVGDWILLERARPTACLVSERELAMPGRVRFGFADGKYLYAGVDDLIGALIVGKGV